MSGRVFVIGSGHSRVPKCSESDRGLDAEPDNLGVNRLRSH